MSTPNGGLNLFVVGAVSPARPPSGRTSTLTDVLGREGPRLLLTRRRPAVSSVKDVDYSGDLRSDGRRPVSR